MKKKFLSSPFRDRYYGCMFEIQANKMLDGALLYRRFVNIKLKARSLS